MKCGLDIGSTLIKAALYNEEKQKYLFLSTKSIVRDQLIESLQEYEVNEVALTGIGNYNLPFTVAKPRDLINPIGAEIDLQVKGVKKLMQWQGFSDEDFLLVSVGTGVSYTHVTKDTNTHFPFGNHMGGGFLLGMSAQIPELDLCADTERRLKKLDNRASRVSPGRNSADILIKDQLPQAAEGPMGDFVVSSCGKLNVNSNSDDVCFGLVNCVATSIIKDVMMYATFGQKPISNLVFIGTTISTIPTLGKLLDNYSKVLMFRPTLLSDGEFAGAVGALTQLGI